MGQARNKTVETTDSVADYIGSIADEAKRNDRLRLSEIMEAETGHPPRMWGDSIVGFGSYHYRYDSGHEGDAPLVGFSPRKNELSIYLMSAFDRRAEMLANLGRHKSGKACIYIKKLTDVDERILRKLIAESVKWIRERYPNPYSTYK